MYLTVPEFIDKILEFYNDDPSRWIQNRFYLVDVRQCDDGICAACLTAALWEVAAKNNALYDDTQSALIEEINRDSGRQRFSIAGWNDASHRTFDDVKNLLLKVKAKHV